LSTVQEIKSAIEQLSSFVKATEDRPLEEPSFANPPEAD
jgi:hypothetical protein